MDRHRQVRCTICSRSMRSDILKRHQLIHKDILSMTEEEVREELRARDAARVSREERRQKVEEIAQQEGIPIDLCIESREDAFIITSLENEMLQDNQEYLDKIELGERVATIIDKG